MSSPTPNPTLIFRIHHRSTNQGRRFGTWIPSLPRGLRTISRACHIVRAASQSEARQGDWNPSALLEQTSSCQAIRYIYIRFVRRPQRSAYLYLASTSISTPPATDSPLRFPAGERRGLRAVRRQTRCSSLRIHNKHLRRIACRYTFTCFCSIRLPSRCLAFRTSATAEVTVSLVPARCASTGIPTSRAGTGQPHPSTVQDGTPQVDQLTDP